MENTIHSLEELFKLCSFSIPSYQRAYSWDEDPQLNEFLSDLRQQVRAQKGNKNKSYFLGTLLLYEDKKVHIVDGQQRITTSVIFIAAAIRRNEKTRFFKQNTEKKLKHYFIYDKVEEVQKLHTIPEDNPFFKHKILGLGDSSVTFESPSSYRLKLAMDYFLSQVGDDEWERLTHTLINAKVMVYSVENAADATLIFELQNDRGKKLTDLEALKSYLMHLVYLHAKNPDEDLKEVQTQFSKIYRHIEGQAANKRIPSEDAILSYHCAANLPWKEDGWRHPKDLIKNTIKNLDESEVTKWLPCFVSDLHESYKNFSQIFSKLDNFTALSEMIILDRMASFWPLILKSYSYDHTDNKDNFKKACRLMEVYAMRGYGLSNLRSDAGLSSIYLKARDFDGGYQDLFTFLYSMSYKYDVQNRFERGLEIASLYLSNRRSAQYLLWKYENYLRSQPGKKVEHLSWEQYLSPSDAASRLSIEHIAAQKNPISETIVEWDEGEQKKFHEIATHRLGNLVLDSVSANSSKGKYDFTDKLDSLSKNSTFLSQGELIDWAVQGEDGRYYWKMDSIKARHNRLIEFAYEIWNPEKYFCPPQIEIQEENLLEGTDSKLLGDG